MASSLLQERPVDAMTTQNIITQSQFYGTDYQQQFNNANQITSNVKRARQLSMRRTRNGSTDARKSIRQRRRPVLASEASPLCREGRKFTVTSMGTNGMLYLRPAIRPGSQRGQACKPKSAFSLAEVSLPGDSIDTRVWPPDNLSHQSCPSDVRTTCSPPVFAHVIQTGNYSPDAAPLTGRHIQGRSQSFSTLDERHSYTYENDPASVRIVIDRQALAKRPKTTDSCSVPQLEIPIPHYRLGYPYFSQRGTPILRGSTYTRGSGIDDIRSSYLSKLEYDRLFPHPTTIPRNSTLTRRRSEAFPQPRRIIRNDATINCLPTATNSNRGEAGLASSTSAVPNRSIRFASMPIAPEIFDIIAANPNDPTVVRYSSTGEMAAATPSRLIDHITSPNILDYELLSDFFLTCRSFLKTADLISYLIARLRWAVSRDNDYGRIVRVRTFVALRHWILNYFVDDFISDFALRFQFCKAVNDLTTELGSKSDGASGDLKIIGELKKCWRRTCMLYWRNSASQSAGSIKDDIYPGDPVSVVPTADMLTTSFVRGKAAQSKSNIYSQGKPLRQKQPLQPALPLLPVASGNLKPIPDPDMSLASSRIPAQASETMPLSPMSEHSVQAASCSIPRFITPKIGCTSDRPQQILGDGTLAGAAIAPKALRMYPPSATTTGTNFTKKSGHHKHKRSGSFSDALRDERTPLSQPMSALSGEQALISDIPSNFPSGSLVRGAIFPPVEPYVKLTKYGHLASTPQLNCTSSRKGATLSDDIGTVGNNGRNNGFALNSEASIAFSTTVSSNPGVKKILGSVRRAISGRQPAEKRIAGNSKYHMSKAALRATSATSAADSSSSTIMSRGIDNEENNTTTNLRTANNVKKKLYRNQDRHCAHGQVRVDILAAKAAISYNEAISAKSVSERDQDVTANKFPPTSTSQPNIWGPVNAKADALGIFNTAEARRDNVANSKLIERSEDIRLTGDTASALRSIVVANDTSSFNTPRLPDYPEGQGSKEVNIGFTQQLQQQQQKQQQQHERRFDGGSHISSVFPSRASSEQGGHHKETLAGNTPTPFATYPYDPYLSIPPLGDPQSILCTRNNSDADVGAHMHSARLSKTLPLKRSKSAKSQQSRPASLRRYASYQSGITSQRIQPQRQPNVSVDAVAFAGVRSVSAQSLSPSPSLSSFPSPSNIPFAHNPPAARQIRRRPGGNLRNFGNVHDLERSRSTGSLSNRTHSITNSTSYKPFDKSCSNGQFRPHGANGLLHDNENLSLIKSGGLPRRPYSLVQTHSSQPNLRPSFEAEVAKLAALPDEDDEGAGIEAALLKLEGRFERSCSHVLAISPKRQQEMPFAEQRPGDDVNNSAPEPTNMKEEDKDSLSERIIQNSRIDTLGNSLSTVSDDNSLQHRDFLPNEDLAKPPAQIRKQSITYSDQTYSSIPLLQRGLSQKNGSKLRKAGEDFQIGNLQAAAQTRASIEREGNSESIPQSPELPTFITTHNATCDGLGNTSKCGSRSPSPIRKLARSPAARDSFLLDSDESLSDVASDISTGDLIMSTISGSEEVVSFYDDGVGYEFLNSNFEDRRARQDIFKGPPKHLPTSDSSEGSIKATPVAETWFAEQLLQQQETLQQQQNTIITFNPGTTVASVPRYYAHGPHPPSTATENELRQLQLSNEILASHSSQSSPSSASVPLKHIPFILMYSAETLAQQFTIIEKDALDEIDWKELIELRWDQSAKGVQTWVEYLLRDANRASGAPCDNSSVAATYNNLITSRRRKGVDTAIARFNLVVKWAVSECVLTENIEERARVLVKYIHIAAHTRQLRNYATMYQITIALLSSDCSRLTRTWDLVPEADRETLRTLENLAQPLRNFSNLRREMETAPLENGCIPFIGIYTHDLIYNSHKPAYIRPTDPMPARTSNSPIVPTIITKAKEDTFTNSDSNTVAKSAVIFSNDNATNIRNMKGNPKMDEVVKDELLVNFERHRTAATIVKKLLRLLHASSKYDFKPEPEVISRCLWMAALPDDEITSRSRNLVVTN